MASALATVPVTQKIANPANDRVTRRRPRTISGHTM